ncbi:hypothetical protein [Streptomyces sp. KR80]|uniref:hypothetical protein n=1 Tax=Streptomyces sp. KR80 TaxID=3457426 RepID=UPI003FCF9C76
MPSRSTRGWAAEAWAFDGLETAPVTPVAEGFGAAARDALAEAPAAGLRSVPTLGLAVADLTAADGVEESVRLGNDPDRVVGRRSESARSSS